MTPTKGYNLPAYREGWDRIFGGQSKRKPTEDDADKAEAEERVNQLSKEEDYWVGEDE